MERIKTGDYVQHFKREYALQNQEERDTLKYLYEVICTDAIDTVTESRVVVYQALYGEHKMFVRPYEDFISEVDHKKYPDIKQKYKFEKINNDLF